MKKTRDSKRKEAPTQRFETRINERGDWRSETLSKIRRLIQRADPEVVEEVKWRKPSAPAGVPAWTHDGLICTGETYESVVKLTFAYGAQIADPKRLFNSSLDGNTRRAIDLHGGDPIDETAFIALVRDAVALNESRVRKSAAKAKTPRSTSASGNKTVLLSGGNPQIAKADGDAPVQAYIAAMPGWKRDVGRRLDALIVRTVPNVRKAVKWNSPFYGIEGQGWFLGVHVYTHYVKVGFFKGTSLRPAPPGGKTQDVRWIDIHEDDLDEAQMAEWIRQAAEIPGWGKS